MTGSNIIDLDSIRRRRAAQGMGLDDNRLQEPAEMEKAAFSFFNSITLALDNGAEPEEVDRLVARMDRVLDVLERRVAQGA
jgi:hypothetical protein